jgi:hypothetical protein
VTRAVNLPKVAAPELQERFREIVEMEGQTLEKK